MIQAYQMFMGGVDMDPSCFFSLPSEAITRGHPYQISKLSLSATPTTTLSAVLEGQHLPQG